MKTEQKYSKETLKLATMTWNEDGTEIRSTNVIVGETYLDKDDDKTKYKITDETFHELTRYQSEAEHKFRVTRHGNTLTLIGIK